MQKGIDVSKWQGNINWNKIPKDINFAIIRSSWGKKNPNQIDKKFRENVDKAKSYGINVGAYHYTYADSVKDARNEAEFFLECIHNIKFEYPVVIDIEDRTLLTLSNEKREEICKEFCETLEANGYYAMIYCSFDWFKNKINGYRLANDFDFWIAKWGNTEPTLPHGIWQYSETGRIPGIDGYVDLNLASKEYPQIIKNKHLNNY